MDATLASPSYTGDLAQWGWSRGSSTPQKTYAFGYDGNHLVGASTSAGSVTIFISASMLSPNLSFGNATLSVSAQKFGMYSQTKSIEWKIGNY